MAIQGIDLSVIWGVIIAFGLMMYVIMDGFDLGLGILFPDQRLQRARCDDEHRRAGLGWQ